MSDETLPHPRVRRRATNDSNPSSEYALCHREGVVRIFWRMDVGAIILHGRGLQWTAPDSTARHATFADITRIRLVAGSDGESGLIGSCIIHFKNQGILTVMGGNSWGVCDPEKAELYRQFVHDLHVRLSAEDRTRIEFQAGQSEESRGFSQVAMILMGLFFLVLPLVLFIVTGEAKCLFLMLGGLAFASQFFGHFKVNAPRNYTPNSIPSELLP